jgi:hypothetical protein
MTLPRFFPLVLNCHSLPFSSILLLAYFLEIKYCSLLSRSCHHEKNVKNLERSSEGYFLFSSCKFLMVVSQMFSHYFSSCDKELTMILLNIFLFIQNIIQRCLDELKCKDLEINHRSVTLNSSRIFPLLVPPPPPPPPVGGGATCTVYQIT